MYKNKFFDKIKFYNTIISPVANRMYSWCFEVMPVRKRQKIQTKIKVISKKVFPNKKSQIKGRFLTYDLEKSMHTPLNDADRKVQEPKSDELKSDFCELKDQISKLNDRNVFKDLSQKCYNLLENPHHYLGLQEEQQYNSLCLQLIALAKKHDTTSVLLVKDQFAKLANFEIKYSLEQPHFKYAYLQIRVKIKDDFLNSIAQSMLDIKPPITTLLNILRFESYVLKVDSSFEQILPTESSYKKQSVHDIVQKKLEHFNSKASKKSKLKMPAKS